MFFCHTGVDDHFSVDCDEFSIVADGGPSEWHLDLLAVKAEGTSNHLFLRSSELPFLMTTQSNLHENKSEKDYNRKTFRYTWSNQNIERLRQWLHVCRIEHTKCNWDLDRLRQSALPKQLLLVKDLEQASDTITFDQFELFETIFPLRNIESRLGQRPTL